MKFENNSALNGIKAFLFTSVSAYLFLVLVVTLIVLTILKMKKITHNKWYAKDTIKKIGCSIWVITFLVSLVEQIAYEFGVYPPGRIWWRALGIPSFTFPSFFMFLCCLVKIYIAVRMNHKRQLRYRRGAEVPNNDRNYRNCLIITLLQVFVFLACFLPLATLRVLGASGVVSVEDDILVGKWLKLLAGVNCLCDPIIFFIVYRRIWRTRVQAVRQPLPIAYDGKKAFVVTIPSFENGNHRNSHSS